MTPPPGTDVHARPTSPSLTGVGTGEHAAADRDDLAARLRALVDASPAAIIEIDRDGIVREWNPAAERLLGWRAEDVIARPLPEILVGATLELPRLLRRMQSGPPPATRQLRCRRRDGRMIDIEVSLGATLGPHGELNGVVGLVIDVTERKRLERKLRHQAQHDSLTGLPNRGLLTEKLTAALETAAGDGRQTGLLLLDLDRFKEVNDTLGHECGDQLLMQVGPRLLAAVLRQDDFVARLSGDEFAVLLPDLDDIADAVGVAQRALDALHASFPVGDTTADVAASIGVAVAPDHGATPAELLRHADHAMYEAKETAAGVVVYSSDRSDRTITRLGMLGELRRALESDGELIAHYQPKIDLATGELRGVEALVRWQHPERGLVSPDEFIPIAETTGLINRLTAHVLDIALAQARAWNDGGLAVPVSVNLSPRCLHDPALRAAINAALDRHAVPPALLCLEITENAIMRDPEKALTILHDLSAGGIRLSLDDFGMGYSSMSYLRQLPVSELKVDRSFIRDLAGDHDDAVLVRSAVDLGHNLGLTVVAEGVEDDGTVDTLHRLGCDIAQGYHFARPMSSDQLAEWLSNRAGSVATTGRRP